MATIRTTDERMNRAEFWVTIQEFGYAFRGLLYGYRPGCWFISRKDALNICELYSWTLPRMGYERILEKEGSYSVLENISDAAFRVHLRDGVYECAATGEFVKD